MNPYNPKKLPQRKSIRLKGYDYSQAGLYFITLCVQNRECLFGKIENQELILNDAGNMIVKWYDELERKFVDIKCHEMVVMPNHFHCIIENVGPTPVGADLRVCPNISKKSKTDLSILDFSKTDLSVSEILDERKIKMKGEHVGSPQRDGSPQPEGSSLFSVIQWFKTMTTNEYIRGVKTLGWKRFDGKLWQRNYYEHIIRNEKSFERISNYIMDNPAKWDQDKLK